MRARTLHPAAWWAWALLLAGTASTTTNPLLLLLIVAVAGAVVAARRTDAPWSRAFRAFLVIAAVVLVFRVAVQTLLGSTTSGGPVLFTLPSVPLPEWMAGVRLGGPVHRDGVVTALQNALRLAVVLCCVGAANALANPSRMLRALPGALYEVGVAVSVGLSFAPQAVASVGRIRRARRLRGHRQRGLRAVRGLAVPVLEQAMERSVALAAAMDSRGYGHVPASSGSRSGSASGSGSGAGSGSGLSRRRMATWAATLTGLLLMCLALFAALGPGSPRWLAPAAAAPGVVLLTGGLVVGSRGATRTRYRPDPWTLTEWLVVACGAAAVVGAVLSTGVARHPAPSSWPTLPLPALIGVLVALAPAVIAPDGGSDRGAGGRADVGAARPRPAAAVSA